MRVSSWMFCPFPFMMISDFTNLPLGPAAEQFGSSALEMAGPQRVRVEGREPLCLRLSLQPAREVQQKIKRAGILTAA